MDKSSSNNNAGAMLSPVNGSRLQKRSHSRKKRIIEELSEEERARRLAEQSKTNPFHKFVEGNLILKQGNQQIERSFFLWTFLEKELYAESGIGLYVWYLMIP